MSVSKLDKNSQVLKYLEGKSLGLEVKFTDINDKIILSKRWNEFTRENAKLWGETPGVYIIKHKFLEEFYIGSTSNIEVRLSDHKNSLNSHRKQSKIHLWMNENGGIMAAQWSPLVIFKNFLRDFNKRNPNYNINQQEKQILNELTQLVARVIEQKLITYYKPNLNKKDKVNFTKLKESEGLNKYVAKLPNGEEIIRNSMLQLSKVLGVSNVIIRVKY